MSGPGCARCWVSKSQLAADVKIVIYAVAAVLALGLVFVLRIALLNYRGERSDFTRWPRSEISQHPDQTGIPELREVIFSAPGQPRLAGWYAPSRNRAAVILVHGTGADRAAVIAETGILANAGFGALAIDFPGQGASEGHSLWGGPERQAISAAVDWLSGREEVDPRRIGAFGFSMGAYVLTQAAVLDKRLRAVTLAASPTDVVEQNWVTSKQWGLLSQLPQYWALRVSGMPLDMRPKDVIGAIAPRAILIINGDLDTSVPPYMARQLAAAAGNPKELWMVPGAHHGDYAKVVPEQYRDRLADFFRRTLLN
jgi:dipeptidyl aminopeptidase/acylaminoacyl peptidase